MHSASLMSRHSYFHVGFAPPRMVLMCTVYTARLALMTRVRTEAGGHDLGSFSSALFAVSGGGAGKGGKGGSYRFNPAGAFLLHSLSSSQIGCFELDTGRSGPSPRTPSSLCMHLSSPLQRPLVNVRTSCLPITSTNTGGIRISPAPTSRCTQNKDDPRLHMPLLSALSHQSYVVDSAQSLRAVLSPSR